KEWVVRPRDLDGERLLLLSRHDYPGYWRKVSDYFADNGVNAKIAGEFDGINSLALGLEAGLGLALVAEGANVGNGVQLMKLKPVPDPICVALGHSSRRRLESWEEDFIEAMRVEA
ncbi:MAG: LysR substrate-binding domain-containing protein, partial [Verrucomicrobiota bacterium]